MIIDIALIVILLISGGLAYRKGLAVSMVSMLSWVVCVIGGLLFNTPIKEWLISKTGIDEYIHGVLFAKSQASLNEGDLDGGLLGFPDLFEFPALKEDSLMGKATTLFGKTDDLLAFLKTPIDSISHTISQNVADKITDLLMSIIAFFIIVLAAKLFCGLITILMSKKYHQGVVGFFDGVGGLCFGVIRGAIIILLIFVALIPVIAMVSHDNSSLIMEQLSTSKAAEFIYNKNFLLKFMFL